MRNDKFKNRRFQSSINMKCTDSKETEKKFKSAMMAALASIMTGNTNDAEKFLKVGLLGGNINNAVAFEEIKSYWKH